MTDPLDGAWAKATRADAHLECLKREVGSFFKRDLRTETVGSADDPRGGYTYTVLRAVAPPSLELSCILGDVVANYRAALDHIAWQLALKHLRAAGATKAPTRDTSFVLTETTEQFDNARGKQLVNISHTDQELIRKFQPFTRPHPVQVVRQSPLTWLRELNNRDKHESLNLLVGFEGSGSSLGDPSGRPRAEMIALHESMMSWAETLGDDVREWEHNVETADGTNLVIHTYARSRFFITLADGKTQIDWALDPIGPLVVEALQAFKAVL